MSMSYEAALISASQNNLIGARIASQAVTGDGGLEAAYRNGFTGCFGPEGPEWASVIWEHDEDELRRTSTQRSSRFTSTDWRGKRATHWNYYMKALPATAFRGAQNVGSCTGWSHRAMVNSLLFADIHLRGENQKNPGARIGVATVYANRGHSGDGMSLAAAVQASGVKNGVNIEAVYCDGQYDLTNDDKDEAYGVRWWNGIPQCVLAETTKHKLLRYAAETGEDAILSALADGRFAFHGSGLTARPINELVSPLQSIGGHAQAVLGYDDTDEFRQWYRESHGKTLNDYVVIHDQSWGAWNTFPSQLWPRHLWGERPEGVWVITGSDFMRLVRSWNNVYIALDMGGFPNGGPTPMGWLATVTWTPTSSPIVSQKVDWFVNGELKVQQTITDVGQKQTTSDDVQLNDLAVGQEVAIIHRVVNAGGYISEPAKVSGVIQDDNPPQPPQPVSELKIAFTKRTARQVVT